MLKLFKHELIQSWRNYMLVYFGYLILCVLFGLSINVESSDMNSIQVILLLLLICMLFGIAWGIFLTIARNFKRSMFGQSSYLTMTLPVNTHELLLSKLLSALTWILISSIIVIFGLFLLVACLIGLGEVLNHLPNIFQAIGELFAEIDLVLVFFSSVTSIALSLMTIYGAITLAHTCWIRNHRTFWTIVIFVVFNIVVSVITNDVFSINSYEIYNYGSSSFFLTPYFSRTIIWDVIRFAFIYTGTWFLLEKKIEIQ